MTLRPPRHQWSSCHCSVFSHASMSLYVALILRWSLCLLFSTHHFCSVLSVSLLCGQGKLSWTVTGQNVPARSASSLTGLTPLCGATVCDLWACVYLFYCMHAVHLLRCTAPDLFMSALCCTFLTWLKPLSRNTAQIILGPFFRLYKSMRFIALGQVCCGASGQSLYLYTRKLKYIPAAL